MRSAAGGAPRPSALRQLAMNEVVLIANTELLHAFHKRSFAAELTALARPAKLLKVVLGAVVRAILLSLGELLNTDCGQTQSEIQKNGRSARRSLSLARSLWISMALGERGGGEWGKHRDMKTLRLFVDVIRRNHPAQKLHQYLGARGGPLAE